MRPRVVTAAGLTSAFLTGCFTVTGNSNSRLLSAWQFTEPPGWIVRAQSHGPFGMPPIPNVRSWSPRIGLQIVSLQILPAPRPRALRSILSPYFTKYTVITLCRGLPALLGQERLPFGPSVEDEVATEAAGSIAIASYRYIRSGPPDPAAEAAIRSLCPTRI